MQYFPAISIQKQGSPARGFSALRIVSILRGDLLMDSSAGKDSTIAALNKMNPGMLHKTRESFIQALARLDPSVSLELSVTSFPNLNNPAGNQMEIAIFICCEDTSEALVKEKLVSTFLNLKPLLASFFPETDFRKVTDAEDIKKMRSSQAFAHAVRISRKYETISLGTLFSYKPIGFGADAANERQPSESVDIRHGAWWHPSHDDWSHLIHVMLNQIGPTRVLIRLQSASNRKQALEKMETTVLTCDRFLSSAGDGNMTLKEQAVLLKKQALSRIGQLTEAGFNIGVFLFTEAHSNEFLATILGNTITGGSEATSASPFALGGFHVSDITIETAMNLHCFSDDDNLYSVTEAACAFRMPSPPLGDIPAGFPVKKFRTAPAMVNTGTPGKDDITLALNSHHGVEQPVFVDNESRFRHCFILGQTGTGKSTLMAHLIMQDILAGRGVAVIDPHGEMIDQLVGNIPEERAKDVIFFDPLDTERPIGFNVLEWNTIYERDLIIDELYRTFHHLYDFKQTGGPIFELYFRGALSMLMGDKKRKEFTATLLDFTRFFIDKRFRKYLIDSVDDFQMHDFLKQAEAVTGDASMQNVTPYIISKFARFRDITLTRIIGQTSTKFSFEEIMDQGKILLIKLGKGRFGSTTSALLANMIVGRFKLAAMKRSEMPASERRDFFLYVDEAHNLPSDNFMELLSEARKYRLGLVLATQYAAQLTRTTPETRDNLLSAILGNVGQTIVFRLGPEDAQAMAPSLYPCFGKQDIIGLPNWHGYVRMQQKNNTAAPFSIKTLVDNTPHDPQKARLIKMMSSRKYGMATQDIDQMIQDRRCIGEF